MQENVEVKKKPKIVRKWYLEIDSELVIKNLIFSFFFVFMIVLIFNYIMIPLIRDYKIAFNNADKQQIVHQTVQRNFNLAQGAFSVLARDNKAQLNTLKVDITTASLQEFLSKFFEKINIKSQQSKKDEKTQFIKTTFEVEVISKDLKSLQAFFASLKDSPIDLEISIPFLIRKQENGLFVSFQLISKKTLYKMLH